MTKRRRPDGTPTGVLNVRISTELPDIVKEAADRNGVTDSYYVDLLLADLVERHGGRLPDVVVPAKQREELPISFAA